ncbi:MAG: DUF1176 domain-containing protein [Pseudomonadota bacterium]
MRRLVFTAALSFALTGGTLAQDESYGGADGVQENIYPWSVNCDEALTCRADTYLSTGDEQRMSLILERTGEPDAPIALVFWPSVAPDIGGKVRLRVPALDYSMFVTIRHVPDSGEIRFSGIPLDDDLTTSVLAGLEGEASIEYDGEGSSAVVFDVDFRGLVETLLVMDNHQGRIGRADALVARGGRPADSGINRMALLNPAPLEGDEGGSEYEVAEGFDQSGPGDAEESAESGGFEQSAVVSDEPLEVDGMGDSRLKIVNGEPYPAAWLPPALLAEVENGPGCDVGNVPGEIQRYTWNDVYALYEIPCYLAAYNASSIFVITEDLGGDVYARVLDFFLPPNRGGGAEQEISNPTFAINTGILSSFHLGRGTGDCGTYQKHQLHEVEGEIVTWELLEYREKEDCDGVETAITDYPLVWPQ